MKFRRRRRSILPRPQWPQAEDRGRPLRGQSWARLGADRDRPGSDPGRRPRRLLALALAFVELALLVFLLHDPALSDRQLVVRGNTHLTALQVRHLAGLGSNASLLSIDPVAAATGLERSSWVRSAQVAVALPDRVTISIQEWTPVAIYSAGGAPAWLVSPDGTALAPAGSSPLLAIDGPPAPRARAGQPLLSQRLLVALVQIQRQLPGRIGQGVRSFQIDSCGDLTMVSARGWTAVFGRVLTPSEFATLGAKVAALQAISKYEDLNSPTLVYVNVMNPYAVAVHHTTDKPSPQPSPTPSPTISQVKSTCA